MLPAMGLSVAVFLFLGFKSYSTYTGKVFDGTLHRNENRMTEARQAYEEALKLYRELAQQNADIYLPYVAMTLNNLGALHGEENRMAEARTAYEESLKIYRVFAKVAPAAYESHVREVQDNLDALP
jgi:tetratricopeptide (TPR) repeat protein